jgi:predicted 3-demethylubiquinone-9 3-methyltransferase (glyoxalase superfamily)
MQKITPFLWFDNNAEEAMRFYTSIFENSRILMTNRFGKGGPGDDGKFMTGTFQLDGQNFMVINGGPMFRFTEAVSLFISCKDQTEINYFWDKLSEGGQKSRCGWLKDKFGLSWQVVPAELGELVHNQDPLKAKKVTEELMKMDKIDIEKLKLAAL